MSDKKPTVWLVEHPTHRFVEDVKAAARKAGLIVIDAAVASDADRAEAVGADEAPTLTLKPEFQPAKTEPQAPADEAPPEQKPAPKQRKES